MRCPHLHTGSLLVAGIIYLSMQETKGEKENSDNAQRADKLYMESNLLRIAGALFCHDQKVAGKRTAEIELNPGVIGKHVTVRPDPKLGQPGPLAHKVFVALIKKHSDYGKPIRSKIHFTRREIGRLIGRKEWGGRDSEQLSRALHQIHYAFVRTNFKQGGGRFIEHSFAIFPEILASDRRGPGRTGRCTGRRLPHACPARDAFGRSMAAMMRSLSSCLDATRI
jgi:hypothetical protein